MDYTIEPKGMSWLKLRRERRRAANLIEGSEKRESQFADVESERQSVLS
jgi:hypothetical protein